MTRLGELTPDVTIGSRRFRKDIIIETDPALSGFPEFGLVGHRLRIGSVLLEVVMPVSRCVMVTLLQADLPHERPILRSLANHTAMNLGACTRILVPGAIFEAAAVELL